jgi:beta-aspartyl-peptidase (threonine type)
VVKPAIIVHGGAGTIQPYVWERFRQHAHQVAVAGQRLLDEGASALDAVVAAVRLMEDDVTFNAGAGSALNADGVVECDAFVMTGALESGAVAGVVGVRNPVELARTVMEKTHHLLVVGKGAERLGQEHGAEFCDPAEMITERRLARWQQMHEQGRSFSDDPEREATDDPPEGAKADEGDTVGACALDCHGHMAVANSSGGIVMKMPGRAGDVPVIGSGGYCGPAGAVACTGHGEPVMRVCMAKYAYDLLAGGMPVAAVARRAVKYLVDTVNGRAGLILMDPQGNRAWATSTAHIGVGVPECVPDDVGGSMPAPG